MQLRLFKRVRIRDGRGRLMNVRDRDQVPSKWRADVGVAERGDTGGRGGSYIRRKGEWRRVYLVSRVSGNRTSLLALPYECVRLR